VLDSRKFLLASNDGQGNDIDDLISCISETLITVFPADSRYVIIIVNLTNILRANIVTLGGAGLAPASLGFGWPQASLSWLAGRRPP